MSGASPPFKFNVGGSHRYELSQTVLANTIFQDTLIHGLTRGDRDPSKEIFIDRDGELFRWILFALRTDTIVNYEQTGLISEDLWNKELVYYGLATIEEVKEEDPKRKRALFSENEDEQVLIDKYYDYKKRKRDEESKKQRELNNELKNRQAIYLKLIQSLFGNTYTLIKHTENGPKLPDGARTIDGVIYDIQWLKQYENELNQYAKQLGYIVRFKYEGVGSAHFDYSPASHYNHMLTRHHKDILTLYLVYLD